ncbi:homocysteine S-methyltransferase family protein [Goodfellowiella coeruleoviolacea]|uniref:Homocysteine/selenocysteine methylase (S-methylmethionine-dependent) n=1 Tax=Goodfellowiella coeruleoviolacea TaxID=334858 RepID=A0AAE3GHY4_9PSEU|nr:homocysteine S-methyltransferase family protein [Goodfellowiella coeruleoviolacea]MCP2167727.1 Homocysteine/selenocysteine methylase (S-methylmethionine-dependent) [Goodfellowiella coeruleoviolacea]
MAELTLLDGAVATELQRRGIPVAAPWWTTRAVLTGQKRDVLRAVHEEYVAAGADVITANTFRCNLRALTRAGLADAGLAWMVHAAVGVATAVRNASGGRVRVAGSVAPVEDCYRPDLVPPDEELRTEHRWLAVELLRAGVDLVLVETMNTVREARIAVAEAVAAGAPTWVSFVCGPHARLLSGEPLVEAARAVTAEGAAAVLVNCTRPEDVEACLTALGGACGVPFGAYPNVEDRTGLPERGHVDQHVPAGVEPGDFAALAARWRAEFGASVLGGCCGTTPSHLAAAARAASTVPTP